MRTYSPKASELTHDWYVADAADQVLGRFATQVAHVLRGKHKPTFAPHMDGGDHVIVVNAARIRLTGNKAEQKLSHHHSGYPGGLRSVPVARLLVRTPDEVVRRTIVGMLPKNSVGRAQLRKLKVYAGADHPHAAQRPEPLALQTRPQSKGS